MPPRNGTDPTPDPGPLAAYIASVVARRPGLDPADPSVIDLAETERVLAAARERLEADPLDSYGLDIFGKFVAHRLRLLAVLGLDKPRPETPDTPPAPIRR